MYCSRCGTSNADSSNYCLKCGNALAKLQSDPASIEAPPLGPLLGTVPSAVGVALYAGFWRRVGGYLIDYVVLLIGIVMVAIVMGLTDKSAEQVDGILAIFYLLGPWLYSAILESGPRQATFGKRAVGIKVTGLDGNRISLARATGRHFAEIFCGLTLGIGYVMAAFTQRRQALHDMISSTVVVHATVEPSSVAGMPMAKPIPGWAIALIILASMIPMLGIVAAIAIPAYQDYTIRAQVSEGLALASNVKVAVAEYTGETGDWPVDLAQASLASGGLEFETEGRYVESIAVQDGTITITYGRGANSRISGMTLSLQPLVGESGDLIWVCGNANDPPDTYSNSGGAASNGTGSLDGVTDLLDKYMPSVCRSGFGGI